MKNRLVRSLACWVISLTAIAFSTGALAQKAPVVVLVHEKVEAQHPSLVTDAKGALHIVYQATEPGKAVSDIFYSSSTDGGKTWTDGVNLSKTTGISSEPVIAINEKEVLVAWTDTTSGDERPDVYTTHSLDGGKTWTAALDISKTPGKSSQPAVCLSRNGSAHAVWVDTSAGADRPDVWYSQSPDLGKTWSKARNISKTPGVSSDPTIACGARIYVAWADTTKGEQNRDIWFARSEDGRAWDKSIDVSNTPGLSSLPHLAADASGTVYLAWDDSSSGETHPDVFLAVSRDRGHSFEKSVDISNTPGVSTNPVIAAMGDGKVAVVWTDTTKDTASPDIWMTSSTDAGKTIKSATNQSSTPGVSDAPSVALANGVIYVIWEEEEHGKTHLKLSSTQL